jgi:hypothetical protein
MLLQGRIPGIVEVILCGADSTVALAQSAGPAVQGNPQLTTLKVTLAAHTALPWHPGGRRREYFN